MSTPDDRIPGTLKEKKKKKKQGPRGVEFINVAPSN